MMNIEENKKDLEIRYRRMVRNLVSLSCFNSIKLLISCI